MILDKSDCTPGCAEKASTPVPFSFSFSALAIMMLYSLLAPYTCMSLLVLFSPLQGKGQHQRCSPSLRLFGVIDVMHARLTPPNACAVQKQS